MTESPSLLDHPGVARVSAALRASGSNDQVRILDETARTAQDAATALRVEVAQIVKSLLFTITPALDDRGSEPLLILTAGDHQVDAHKVADLLGVAGLGRANAEYVRQQTGFAIGGVAPIGLPAPIRTLVDVQLARHEVVWAAAGHPHAVFATTYDELLRLTAGQPAEVA